MNTRLNQVMVLLAEVAASVVPQKTADDYNKNKKI